MLTHPGPLVVYLAPACLLTRSSPLPTPGGASLTSSVLSASIGRAHGVPLAQKSLPTFLPPPIKESYCSCYC